jgi:hypothetical protein
VSDAVGESIGRVADPDGNEIIIGQRAAGRGLQRRTTQADDPQWNRKTTSN